VDSVTQCAECPAARLEEALTATPEGCLIQAANDLEFLMEQPGAAVSMDDFSGMEFRTLRALKAARAAWEKEKPKP